MKSKTLIIFIFTCVVALNAYNQNSSLDSLKTWMQYLSADERKGRLNGSLENVAVADWITKKFSKYGVRPLPGNEWLFQDYPSPYGKVGLTNIIGYIPGSSVDSFIILSAHYDHIGMNGLSNGDTVFNGADDDASGICMLLGIAQRIHADSVKPGCSVIFAAFSGEEIGMLGSRSFCENNNFPWAHVKLNLNFEMLGRSGEQGKHKYYITGPRNSNLSGILAEYNKEETWQLADMGYIGDALYRSADNYSFVKYVNNKKHCFPAHTMATSIGEGYVHQVHDEAEFIDFENLNELVEYTAGVVYYLSGSRVVLRCVTAKD